MSHLMRPPSDQYHHTAKDIRHTTVSSDDIYVVKHVELKIFLFIIRIDNVTIVMRTILYHFRI